MVEFDSSVKEVFAHIEKLNINVFRAIVNS